MPSQKVHKSLRIDADTAERVRALVRDGESEASAYGRVLVAGLDAMEGKRHDDADGDSGGRRQGDQEAMRAVSETVAALREQLAVKDEQIRALTGLVEQSQTIATQAQALHAVTEAKALPAERQEDGGQDDGSDGRRGWWSRHFGRR